MDPVRRLIGVGVGLGRQSREGRALPQRHASENDGKTVYRLEVKDVPVDGFWSVSVYNAKGYFEPKPLNAYTLNNITAKKGADGSIASSSAAATAGRELPADPARMELPRCDFIVQGRKS